MQLVNRLGISKQQCYIAIMFVNSFPNTVRYLKPYSSHSDFEVSIAIIKRFGIINLLYQKFFIASHNLRLDTSQQTVGYFKGSDLVTVQYHYARSTVMVL